MWTSCDGAEWDPLTANARQCPNPIDVFGRQIPMDMRVTNDRTTGTKMGRFVKRDGRGPDPLRHDRGAGWSQEDGDALYTFRGDRETFNFFDPNQ